MALWFYGFMVSCFCGFIVWRFYGFIILWFCSFMVLWLNGFVVLWFSGYMVVWFYNFMVLWCYGLMVLWFLGFKNCQTTHFMFSGRSWYYIQDVQDLIRWIFIMFRRLSFPNLSNKWVSKTNRFIILILICF